jgi:hypothetical protein
VMRKTAHRAQSFVARNWRVMTRWASHMEMRWDVERQSRVLRVEHRLALAFTLSSGNDARHDAH